MPCFAPLQGYWAKNVNPSGKRSIVFSLDKAYSDLKIEIPCGQCIGCRVDKTKEWAIRCVHEALTSDSSHFVTLTYAPEHLPKNLSVSKREHQLFMKKLRKRYGKKIRFFMCGEYGESKGRPHYHYLLYNVPFHDLEYWRHGRDKKGGQYPIYRSATLEAIWGKGFVEIGELNLASASYTAGYIRKKIRGKQLEAIDSETHLKPYELYDSETGEIIEREPEFSIMSRRPGLGRDFYERYGEQIRRNDDIVIDGTRMRLPKYYDRISERVDPERHASNVLERRKRAKAQKARSRDLDPMRLRQREAYWHRVHEKSKEQL